MKYEIGARIRATRKRKGLSQKQLADLLQVSGSRVSNWEQGINRPDADILTQICRVLQVSPCELLNIHFINDDLSEQERLLINTYRQKPELQHAICVLLGIGE